MSKKSKQLLPILSILLIAGFLITSLASFIVSRGSLHSEILLNELPLTSDNIYSEIQRDLLSPILISSLMATDTFLRDWVISGEKDTDQVTKYLKDIQKQFNTFTSFFVSDKTYKYYHSNGLLKTVSPTEERDIWYFRVKEMKDEYEINVDIDMANNDSMTIFINYKVYDYNGNYIGATGVGLTVNAVKELIESYQKKYNRNIFFVDKKGTIKLSASNFNKENAAQMASGIPDLFKDRLRSSSAKSFKNKRNKKTFHTNVRYIREFEWFLVVEQEQGQATKHIFTTLVINLLVCAVITLVVLLLVRLTINKYKNRIETLNGIVPICSYCKQIRDDKGYWNQVEAYIAKHTDAEFSHGICPDCREKYFPNFPEKNK